MKYQYPPNYGADNLDYRVFNEERVISSDVERVIVLDYGAYFSSTLKIKNKATGLTLVAGKDYICNEADFVAMNKSGREVCKQVTIKTKAVKEILIDYMFVGGEHMSGLHLMREMARVYPDGLESRYEWDKISDKPITFKPEHHLMHVNQLYGFDGVAYSMDRMIAGVKRGHEDNQNRFMVNILKKLDTMTGDLKDELDEAQNLLDELFDILSVQEGEFIFTDRLDNPAVSRKYGNWVRVTDVILRGRSGNEMLADDAGNIYSKTHNQQIRDCYIWQNLDGQYGVTYKLTFTNAVSAGTYDVDTDITVKLQTTGIVDGTPVYFTIYDEDTGKPASINDVYPGSRGSFVIERGVATTDIRFLAKPNSGVQQRKYTFRLDGKLSVYGLLRVNEPDYKTSHPFFKSKLADVVLTNVDEGMMFRLYIDTQGYKTGEILYLDWNGSSIDSTSFKEPLPTAITITSSLTAIAYLELKENLVSEGDRLLKVTIKKSRDEAITFDSPTTSIIVNDSTVNPKADIYFRNSKNIDVLEMDEGEKGTIVIHTDLFSTDIEVQYSSGKPLSEFTGLKSDLTTNETGNVSLPFGINEDFLTATGTQVLTVIVLYRGLEIGRNNLFIVDTSKAPNYQTFFTSVIGGDVIEGVGEGEEFYYNVKVDGWAATTTPPVLNFKYMLGENAGTTKSEVAERIESSLYNAMAFDKSAGIYSEVSWNSGNTLSFKMKAKEDDIVENSTVFTIMCKQSNQTEYAYPAHLDIYDTSMYAITGTWSSSATKLNPIMSADEMTSTGMNNIVYLWIQTEGDGSKAGDITLNTDANKEFVSVFPEVVRFEEGGQLLVVAVTILADFIKDGDMNIVLTGTYVNKKGDVDTLFEAPLKIVDNSFKTPIELVSHSVETTPIAPNDKKFTAWKHHFVTVTGTPYGFDSDIHWRIEYINPNHKERYKEESGIAHMAAGEDSVIFSLKPERNAYGQGEAEFVIIAERIFTERNIPISDETKSEVYIVKDDAAPMSLKTGFYASIDSDEEIRDSDEGKTVYYRISVTNPDDYYYVGLESITNQGGTQYDVVIDGVECTIRVLGNKDEGTDGGGDVYMVQGYLGPVDKTTVVVFNIPINIPNDRRTAIKQNVYWYEGYISQPIKPLVDVEPNTRYKFAPGNPGIKYRNPYMNSDNILYINDTSQSSTYKVTHDPNVGSIGEGVEVEIVLTITGGTLGDVFYLDASETGYFDPDRIEINPNGVEQVALTLNSVLRWKLKFYKNRKTDDPYSLYYIYYIRNKSNNNYAVGDGYNANRRNVIVYDTSQTPVNYPKVMKERVFNSYLSAIPEQPYGTNLFLTGDNYDTDEQVKLEWLGGRPKEEFPEGIWTTHDIISQPNSFNKTYFGALVPFYLDYDRKTNTEERSYVKVRVSTTLSGIVSEHTFQIADTSPDRAFTEVSWSATSVNEGSTINLRVSTNGHTEPVDVLVERAGGRGPDGFKSHSFDVTKTRTADTDVLVFPFTPLRDGTTNTGEDTMISVKVSIVGTDVSMITSVPINDTSTDTTAELFILNSTTGEEVSRIEEGNVYTFRYIIYTPNQNLYYRLEYGFHEAWGLTRNVGQVSSSAGTTITSNQTGITVNSATKVIPMEARMVQPYVAHPVTGKILAKRDLIIVGGNNVSPGDVYMQGGYSKVKTGYSYYIYSAHTRLKNVLWDYGTNHKLRWGIYSNADIYNNDGIIDERFMLVSSGYLNEGDLIYSTNSVELRVPVNVRYDAPIGSSYCIKVWEEYDIEGEHIEFILLRSKAVTIEEGLSAPAISEVYWSTNAAGTDVITSAKQGFKVYLCCKAKNINDGLDSTSREFYFSWEENRNGTSELGFFGNGYYEYMTMTNTSGNYNDFYGSLELLVSTGLKLTGNNNTVVGIPQYKTDTLYLALRSPPLTIIS